MRLILILLFIGLFSLLYAQHTIVIDGQFDDWQQVTTIVTDPANDEHDTDWYSDGKAQPEPRKYADVDLLEARFTHDRENLYGYVKSRGIVGRTARSADGYKAGRYYFIITIDMDNDDVTGYPIQEGSYWPNSIGYDMNMEVEFYDGAFNTGHYLHHGFLAESELEQGRIDLYNYIIRLAPANYDDYLQWVVFEDSSFVEVSDKGPVYQGILKVAVSEDGHQAEMQAPMWGFFWNENSVPICTLGNTIDISFSLEGSGELSESAQEAGYDGTTSMWGSDTAEPIEDYVLHDFWTTADLKHSARPLLFHLKQNYPNPFNPSTNFEFYLPTAETVNLTIYDAQGRQIQDVVTATLPAGTHVVQWHARDQAGRAVAAGLYFARLTGGNQTATIKILLVR
ncbi:T9SS C-terminal target domain-containing protein [candidate division KSB1 bacterium]|nr:T9SS type A sorting domain-containing protein [candidate division KSB1 bacterium]RQW02170.1 MAG: T9SS C-terminal target domain-containing protein [candidate division KSB1 bacterium]